MKAAWQILTSGAGCSGPVLNQDPLGSLHYWRLFHVHWAGTPKNKHEHIKHTLEGFLLMQDIHIKPKCTTDGIHTCNLILWYPHISHGKNLSFHISKSVFPIMHSTVNSNFGLWLLVGGVAQSQICDVQIRIKIFTLHFPDSLWIMDYKWQF